MAITAWGRFPVAVCSASATAQMPNASAAGMDSAGSAVDPARSRCAARSVAVAAAWASASRARLPATSLTLAMLCARPSRRR
eukprot:775442-Pleurochrysis_carterae.AAC.2